MFRLHTGLLLATLFISACSMPMLDNTQPAQIEKAATQTLEIKETSVSENNTSHENASHEDTSYKDASYKDARAQLETHKKLAEANYTELKKRVGKADPLPRINTDPANIDTMTQQLRSYTSKTNTEITQLNARVNERQKLAVKGDLIRIFLSEATITYKDTLFKAQPLVGQWVRGEMREIRLKENLLLENPQSEGLYITFSETYQLIVNDKVIGIINPNKEKNSASFTVSTQDEQGTIVGQLDYRIVEIKE